MKQLLIVILDHGELVDDLFKDLSSHHYNATVFNARSIKHILEDEENDDIHFFNLSHLDKHNYDTSTSCYFLVDQDQLEDLKNLIREKTGSFKKIKGSMFSLPIIDYEGSL